MNIKKHIPNLITLINLFCGCVAVVFVSKGDFLMAFYMVCLGIFFDFFDGFFARLFKVSSPLGLQLDSLADMVTSGVVPGYVMYSMFARGGDQLGNQAIVPFLGFIITLGACYRLANFNIDTRQTDSFIGLPTPANAIFIISLQIVLDMYADSSLIILELLTNQWVLLLITLGSAYIMNAEIPLFSLKIKKFSLKDNALQIVFLIVSVLLGVLLHYIAIPLIIVFYVLLSIINNLFFEEVVRIVMARKTTYRKTYARKPAGRSFLSRLLRGLLLILFSLLFIGIVYHYRKGLAYYLGFKSEKVLDEDAVDKHLSDVRNIRVLENHKGKVIGIDVSEFQGKVDWEEVEILDEKYPVQFVFIRATAGNDRVDRQFKKNWEGAKENKIMRGAYHYYRPNENSIEQADLFIKTVKLQKGDLPPVLDIEKLPKNQSLDSLKKGLKRWLVKVEKHYQVRPIIYSGERYYSDFLKEEFGDYLFWIANYNFYREKIEDDWLFWQFTEKASLPGIKHRVDVNIYNGDIEQLQFITVE